jgi:hypothetical protein
VSSSLCMLLVIHVYSAEVQVYQWGKAAFLAG